MQNKDTNRLKSLIYRWSNWIDKWEEEAMDKYIKCQERPIAGWTICNLWFWVIYMMWVDWLLQKKNGWGCKISYYAELHLDILKFHIITVPAAKIGVPSILWGFFLFMIIFIFLNALIKWRIIDHWTPWVFMFRLIMFYFFCFPIDILLEEIYGTGLLDCWLKFLRWILKNK